MQNGYVNSITIMMRLDFLCEKIERQSFPHIADSLTDAKAVCSEIECSNTLRKTQKQKYRTCNKMRKHARRVTRHRLQPPDQVPKSYGRLLLIT
jgi:hypothetical protein